MSSAGYHPPAATLLTVKDLPCEKGRRRTYDNNKPTTAGDTLAADPAPSSVNSFRVATS